MSTAIRPTRASSRPRAQEVFEQLPADLTGVEVRVDFHDLRVAAPSFLDELLRLAAERNARSLVALAASPRVARHLEASAERRGLRDRLTIDRVG